MKRIFFSGVFLFFSFILIGQESLLDSDLESESLDEHKPYSEFSENEVSEYIMDIKGKLRKMKFQDEIFIPEKNKEETVFIDKADKEISRSFYNSNHLLVRKEIWSMGDVLSSRIIKAFDYKYSENQICVFERITTDENETETFFNESGLVLSEQRFEVSEKKEKRLSFDRKYKYDGKGNLLIIETNSFPCDGPQKSEVHKYVYSKGDNVPPDLEYYVDGVLNLRTIYKSEDDFTKEIFFENDFIVKTEYKNGTKVHEKYISDGKLLRENFYE